LATTPRKLPSPTASTVTVPPLKDQSPSIGLLAEALAAFPAPVRKSAQAAVTKASLLRGIPLRTRVPDPFFHGLEVFF
jgi:hypothetical protein